MPDRRRHRGPHPGDAELFGPAAWDALRTATAELSWLLGRGYASRSATALVGDRHGLTKRQRDAVGRCAAADTAVQRRGERELRPEALAGRPLWIDGYNALTTIEAALAGGVVLLARDGCYRDVASVHGSWRRVAETLPALTLLGAQVAAWRTGACRFLLDRPVSNSGRLKTLLLAVAEERSWSWQVELVASPDRLLAATDAVVATSDSVVLDRCGAWVNLARRVIDASVPGARVVDLSGGARGAPVSKPA